MSRGLLVNIGRFILVVLLQVLLLNHIDMGGYLNPYFYIIFLLLLPIELPVSAVMILGFLLGFSVDMFTNTMGMHTTACVFMGFCRSFVLKFMAPREGYEFGTQSTIRYMGFTWFVSYAGILTLMHHLVLFFVEVFRLSSFFSTLGRVLLSTLFTLVLIIISQFLAGGEKRET